LEYGKILFQCNLMLDDRDNGWSVLINEAPLYPKEIQLSDIKKLSEKHRMFLAVDELSIGVIDGISNSLPMLYGISAALHWEAPKRKTLSIERAYSVYREIELRRNAGGVNLTRTGARSTETDVKI